MCTLHQKFTLKLKQLYPFINKSSYLALKYDTGKKIKLHFSALFSGAKS